MVRYDKFTDFLIPLAVLISLLQLPFLYFWGVIAHPLFLIVPTSAPAMLVTPVPLNRYLLYRVALPLVLAFLIIIVMVLVINHALLPFWQLVVIAAGASFAAPITNLFYGITSDNKVQAFAYAKFTGITGWTIMMGWFVPVPWQWLFGFFPPFWISKAYWLALAGNGWWWLALIAGILIQIGLIAWVAKMLPEGPIAERPSVIL